jgi:hypothetical protein
VGDRATFGHATFDAADQSDGSGNGVGSAEAVYKHEKVKLGILTITGLYNPSDASATRRREIRGR